MIGEMHGHGALPFANRVLSGPFESIIDMSCVCALAAGWLAFRMVRLALFEGRLCSCVFLSLGLVPDSFASCDSP